MNTAMATYAWNVSPVDGTDIIRSFTAKARTFRFPLDIQEDAIDAARIPAGEGEAAIQHVKTMFPLWCQQKGLLELLQATRRERHLQVKNDTRKERKFNTGDSQKTGKVERTARTTGETNTESKRALPSIGESRQEQLLVEKVTSVARHNEEGRKEAQRSRIQNDEDPLDVGDTQKNGQHGHENHEDERRHRTQPIRAKFGTFQLWKLPSSRPKRTVRIRTS
jgi:hypothetical protein